MLSVAKLSAGAEDYYLLTVARGVEDYYTGAGEAPGVWIAKGSADLGLAGSVTPDALHTLLSGRSPVDGSPIRSLHAARATVAGFDMTFSCPKSVSLMWGLTNEAISAQVRDGHDQAVASALEYIEAHALKVRRGHGGTEAISAKGLIAAAFRHRTSRAGDPQLHTHVLVANAARGADGAFSAPDGRLFYLHARAAGYLYQCVLRRELCNRLGVSFGPVVKGAAEIDGVDPAMVRAFSTRRVEIEARLANYGATSPAAARMAALITRRTKEPSPPTRTGAEAEATLTGRWRAQARALGHDPGRLACLVGPPRFLDLSGGLVHDVVDELVSPTGLTAKLSTFERRDAVRMAAAAIAEGADAHVVDHIANLVLQHPRTVGCGSLGPGGEERLTTTELLHIEAALVDLAVEYRGDNRAVASGDAVAGTLRATPRITGEQAAMVQRLTTSGAGVDVVVGAAGTGKTFALGLAREIWEKGGYRCRGVALAARAARQLEAASKIPSTTLSALDTEIAQGRDAFGAHSVLVVDEAAMVGTRMLSRVVKRVVDAAGKVVLVGDHRQLPEIDTGGAFEAIAREVGAVELSLNRRQVNAWERDALSQLRSGEVSVALSSYESSNRVREYDSITEARSRLVADWFDEVSAFSYKDARMLAVNRADVDALNSEAHATLRRSGLLGPTVYSTSDRCDFSFGEDVICLKNDRRLGVLNGTRASVVGVARGGLRIRTDNGTVDLPHSYMEAGHLTYGYASTIHKAQGATCDTAFVLASGSLYREAAYVAMSRAREASYLYTVPDTLGVSATPCDDLSIESAHPRTPRTPNLTLLETVSRSQAKTLATDQLAASRRRPKNGDADTDADQLDTARGFDGPTSGHDQRRLFAAGESEPKEWSSVGSAPIYITDTLGQRPRSTLAGLKWDRAAQRIDSYRRHSGWSGPSALGPTPSDRVARMKHVSAMNALLDYQRFAERDRSRQRSRDVGLSL